MEITSGVKRKMTSSNFLGTDETIIRQPSMTSILQERDRFRNKFRKLDLKIFSSLLKTNDAHPTAENQAVMGNARERQTSDGSNSVADCKPKEWLTLDGDQRTRSHGSVEPATDSDDEGTEPRNE